MDNQKKQSIKKIFSEGTWYHAVDFEDVTTKGTFDYRELVTELNFPQMDKLSVLDIGCSDGFLQNTLLKI